MTTTIDTPTIELENGSRATTPTGDNLLLAFARAEAEGYHAQTRAAGGRTESVPELGLHLNDTGSPFPFANLVHLTRPVSEEETPAVAAAITGFYAGHAGGAYLVFSPWSIDLGAHGFGLGGHPPFMVRPAGGAAPVVPGFHIAEVTTPAQLAVFEQTIAEAYPAPELLPFGSQPRVYGDAILSSNWRLFVGYEGDRPVATGAGYVTDHIVVVEAISSRSECRGKGYGAAVTAAAMLAAPDRPSALIASDLGRGVYERLGFLPVLRYTLWVGTAR
jgi:hypothetical protein